VRKEFERIEEFAPAEFQPRRLLGKYVKAM